MKQHRILACLWMALVLLTACGGGSGGDDPTPTSATPQTYQQSVTVAAKGGTQTVTLYDLSSAVSSVSSTPSWLVISPQFYSSGAPTVKLEVAENTGTTARSSVVTISAASGDKVRLTVTQEAAGGTDTPTTGIDDVHNNQSGQPAYAPKVEG